ncbi:MAG: tetratricopeptide repeat protein, partial [Myxococcales bacterium]|nr:tetratricopeptide repeat protein [Myxococcales bacterium]
LTSYVLFDRRPDVAEVDAVEAAQRFLDERDRALERMGVPAEDERWGKGRCKRALLAHVTGQVRDARTLSRSVTADAERLGWSQVLPEILFIDSVGARMEGQIDEALALLDRAAELALASGDARGAARCHGQRGWVLLSLRRLDDAEEAFRTCDRIYGTKGDTWMQGVARTGLGAALIERGQLEEAQPVLADALQTCEVGGFELGAVDALNHLGLVSQRLGRLDDAERWFVQAASRAEQIEAGTPLREARGLLSLVQVETGRHTEALPVLEGILAELEANGTWMGRASLLVGLASCDQAQGRPAAAEQRLAQALEAAERSHEIEPVLVRIAGAVGERAAVAGHEGCAQAAERFVAAQLAAAGGPSGR